MKRAQELRVDELSVQKLRESHETIQRLSSQLHSVQEQMNSRSDSGKFEKWNRITVEKILTFPVNQQSFQVHVLCKAATNACHLATWNLSGPQENVFGSTRAMLGASQISFQGILHSTNQSATGWNRIIVEDVSRVPGQPEVIPSSSSMLSRDKRLPFDTWNNIVDHRILGVPLSAIEQQFAHRKDKVKKLILMFEKHRTKNPSFKTSSR